MKKRKKLINNYHNNIINIIILYKNETNVSSKMF